MDSYHQLGTILVLWLFLYFADGDGKVSVKGSMGSRSFCNSAKRKTYWLSEDTSALLIGKSESEMAKDCTVVIGAAVKSTKSVRLRIHFDYLYFDSCGVRLQINQSSISDFHSSKDNKEMFMSGCNRKNPGPLYAQPKHYIKISLNKDSNSLEAYNFRLNVSVIENLPETGTPLRVIIIVSFVCFVIVVAAAFVVYKYANHLSMEWSEERREERMDRAIHLYNSSSREASGEGESSMALVEPGAGVRLRQQNRPVLGFVHSDGRVLRFQQRGGHEEVAGGSTDGSHHRLRPSKSKQLTTPQLTGRSDSPSEEPTHFYLSFSQQDWQDSPSEQANTSSHLSPDNADTASIGGVDLPPTYEEALAMPLPVSDSAVSGGGDDSGGVNSCGNIIGACGGVSISSSSDKTSKGKGKKKLSKPSEGGGARKKIVITSDSNTALTDVQGDGCDFGVGEEEKSHERGQDYVNYKAGGHQAVSDNNRGLDLTTATTPTERDGHRKRRRRHEEDEAEEERDHPLVVYPNTPSPPPSLL